MKIAGVLLFVLAVGIGVVCWLGVHLPLRHRAGVAINLRQTPESIYDTIADVTDAPLWRKDVKSVELLPEESGRARFRETGANGVIAYRIEAAERPQRFVTFIDDASLPFDGNWTFVITPSANGSRVEIVEEGEIRSVVFRFFAHYVFGYHRTLDGYLTALAAKFGEAATIEHLPIQ